MSYIGNKPADTIASSSDIADGAITAAKLASSSVTQPKINGGVAGTGPAFSAYLSANQSVTTGVATKVAYDTEEFDTNNNFASSRFTPTVAGYYQINASCYSTGTAQNIAAIYLYKNGSNYKQGGVFVTFATTTSGFNCLVSTVVYMNGSADYLEVYGLNSATSPVFSGGIQQTWFNGVLVRAA